MTCRDPHPATMRCEVWGRVHLTSASNTESASNNASNRPVEDIQAEHKAGQRGKEAVSVSSVPKVGQSEDGGVVLRKQRWGRDKYNAYQREYMRKRRAACD